jgi:predicted transcriptional regulator
MSRRSEVGAGGYNDERGENSMKTKTSKESILQALDEELSDDATLADALDYLYYLIQIEEGLADADAGNLIPHEEVVRRIEEWTK